MPLPRQSLAIVLSFGCIVNPAIGQDNAVADPNAASSKTTPVIESINEAMVRHVEAGDIAGAVTLLGQRGKVIHLAAVGKANIERDRDMKPFHKFAIASMTKPITATALMILQDEGKVSVDDKVSQYLPEFATLELKDGTPAKREITIRDCLTHSAGLSGSQLFEGSLADAMEELATRPLDFQPGTKWQYSPGVSVAGRIVEVVSGQSLGEFLRQRIFTPLDMNNTTFHPDEKQRRNLAQIYNHEEGRLVAVDNRLTDFDQESLGENPSAGLVSTARDLFRFYQMVLNGGKFRKQRILSEAAVAQMTSPQTGDLDTGFTPGNAWGLGWCVVQQPQGVTKMLHAGTFGHGGAFGTQGWVDPQSKAVFVLLIQHGNIGNGDASDIRKSFQQAAVAALR